RTGGDTRLYTPRRSARSRLGAAASCPFCADRPVGAVADRRSRTRFRAIENRIPVAPPRRPAGCGGGRVDRRSSSANRPVPSADRSRPYRGTCQRADARPDRQPGADPARPLMRIAVLVPAPDYPEPWRWTYDPQADALRRAGAEVEPIVWTAAGDLAGFDL